MTADRVVRWTAVVAVADMVGSRYISKIKWTQPPLYEAAK
jgi:hypothetical protein